LSGLSGANGNAPISLKQTEFSLKQFANRMGQPNLSMFNKGIKVWVAWFLEKNHHSIIPEQNSLKQLRDECLHSEMVAADFLETIRNWLALKNFDNAEWIGQK